MRVSPVPAVPVQREQTLEAVAVLGEFGDRYALVVLVLRLVRLLGSGGYGQDQGRQPQGASNH